MAENKEVIANRDTFKAQLEAQAQSLEAERLDLKGQIDTLLADKSTLEKNLADAKALSEKVAAGGITSVSFFFILARTAVSDF